MDQHIPKEHESRDHLPYYQWVPLIMLLQALFFYIPIMVWRSLNSRAGVLLSKVVKHAESIQNADCDTRETNMEYMADQMDR